MFRDPSASTSQVVGLKACATTLTLSLTVDRSALVQIQHKQQKQLPGLPDRNCRLYARGWHLEVSSRTFQLLESMLSSHYLQGLEGLGDV